MEIDCSVCGSDSDVVVLGLLTFEGTMFVDWLEDIFKELGEEDIV